MSRTFHINSFDLLGQNELYTYPVKLPGKVQPKLDIAWNGFHSNFLSGLPVFFQRARIDKNAPPSAIFPDAAIEGRIPLLGVLAAALLHALIFLVPWPNIPLTPQRNSAFDNTELTWSGPIQDLPLVNIPRSKGKSAPKPAPAEAKPAESSEAFHPRQRISTDPVHPTHPRQTLIHPAAPPDAPKFLPEMPNVVQIAASNAPARPHIEISEKSLAKLHPKVSRQMATTDEPTPEIAAAEQRAAALNITAGSAGPEKPKLQIDPSSAPRAAERKQSGDTATEPEVAVANSPEGTASSTLIALSARPAPPAPVIPLPQGNLAARVAISPDGKPGASGDPPSALHGKGSGSIEAPDPGGVGSNNIGVSISGGNPRPNTTASGLGGATKFSIPRTQSAMKRPEASVYIEDPPERSGPPNFATLSPDAKPEQIFSSKHIYSLNVNMPNLNSVTGSWIIHFSELHLSDPAHRSDTVTSPVPVRKVDPKYPQELALEHVEGEVILYGVIRRDGSVDSIQKVRGVDPQLDANSIAAFAQWKFQPATREGEAVDLEAIVYIPFKTRDRRNIN